MVNRVDLLGRAVGQSYGYFDYLCGGNSLASAAALWLNNGISLPGGCPAYYMTNTYATALNATGDICGYGPGPVPNGA